MRSSPLPRRLLADWKDYRLSRSLRRQPPQLMWKVGPRAPQRCVEAARARLGDELFLFGGYISMDRVSNRVDVLDLGLRKWTKTSKLPAGMPHTHNGTTTDGKRYIFSIGGQLGPNCSPAVASCFAFDAQTHKWMRLPDLPEPRYMPLVQFYNGKLHCLGGSKKDRQSPAADHWSLPIENGQPLNQKWLEEAPLPSGRTHAASHMVGAKLFVFGGQQGDVPPIPGDPEFACNFDSPIERLFDEVYAFDLETHRCEAMAPMPQKVSHTEHAVLQIDQTILIVGGVLDRMTTNDVILAYNLTQNRWDEIGRLPYPMKSKIAAYKDGWLYIATGQRSYSQADLRPGEVLDSVWMARLEL